MTLLGRPEREVWRMPVGYLLDQIAVYTEFHCGDGSGPESAYIEDIMPPDI